jgi:hypothetical protein
MAMKPDSDNMKSKNFIKLWDTIKGSSKYLIPLLALIVSFLAYSQSIKTAKVQTRAWVSPGGDETDIINDTTPNGPINIAIKVTNRGHTPAYEVRLNGKGKIGPWPMDVSEFENPQLNNSAAPTTTLFPDQSSTLNVFREVPLTLSEIESLEHDNQWLFAFGQIRYRDAFGAEHYTDLCIAFNQPFVPHPTPIRTCSGIRAD